MMIKCPNCGLKVSSKLKRCFACSYPLEDVDIPAEFEPEPASEPGVGTEPETQKETSVVIIEPEVAEISDPIVDPVEPFNWRLYLKIGLAILAGFVLLMIYVGSSSEDHAQALVDEAAKRALTEPVTQEVSEETSVPQSEAALFDGSNYSDMGSGIFYLVSDSGTTEHGDVIVIYALDYLYIPLGFEAWDFDGSLITHIYIDGVEIEKDQLHDTQGSIELSGEMLTTGRHLVEAVQFAENDIQGEVVTYKANYYEIKED